MIEASGIVICSFCLVLLIGARYAQNKTKEYMLIACINMLIYNICLLILELTQVGIISSARLLVILSGLGTYVFPLVAAYYVSLYVVSLISADETALRFHIIPLTVLLGVEMMVIAAGQMTNRILIIDMYGLFSYGPGGSLGFITVDSFMLIDVYLLIRYGQKITSKQRIAFITYIALPVLAIPFKAAFPDVYIVALASCISMMIMMRIIVVEQSSILENQRIRNEQLKVDLMLAQIQPHFLFNMLYEIQEICLIDAVMASEAIEDFSRYLRHNMDSISINTPIPFAEELEHVGHYVSLQQLRFGDAVRVEYDLNVTDFKLPTLTLQPLVENAIRYGVRKRSDGRGTVTIRTLAYPNCVKICVMDNGPGFASDQKPADGSTHIGIKNVRERLARISGGDLIIHSDIGVGTEVILIIPKKKHNMK